MEFPSNVAGGSVLNSLESSSSLVEMIKRRPGTLLKYQLDEGEGGQEYAYWSRMSWTNWVLRKFESAAVLRRALVSESSSLHGDVERKKWISFSRAVEWVDG